MMSPLLYLLGSLLLVKIRAQAGVDLDPTQCRPGMIKISGATPESCYSMRQVSEGTANRTEAAIYCGEEFQSTLPTPKTMEEIAAINVYVIGQGVPRNSIPGYFCQYKRKRAAPLVYGPGTDFPTLADVLAVRRDKDLYVSNFPVEEVMPHALWGNRQPGEKTDARDEMCVARKKPGKTNYKGLDDYVCEGGTDHYVVCEQTLVFRELLAGPRGQGSPAFADLLAQLQQQP
ncbi:uncharacterized protein LOC142340862 [Convolutriloba macropyga]|uniref:uncharacterized protein LOC142340862 n=1 Tax=Convolutriloba macropyga TaxID=536237 RepID=UPI003F51B422